jgi:organic radical activating enzyme
MKRYAVSEVFYSLQGEGARAGMPCVFLRLAGCNLSCSKDTAGFNCDTDHQARMALSAPEVIDVVTGIDQRHSRQVIVTGGEPLLQLDRSLLRELNHAGFAVGIETNGTLPLPTSADISYVACSPKRDMPVMLTWAHECRIVLAAGDAPPEPPMTASRYYLSPASEGDTVNEEAMRWCIDCALRDPRWLVSIQQHKAWGIK